MSPIRFALRPRDRGAFVGRSGPEAVRTGGFQEAAIRTGLREKDVAVNVPDNGGMCILMLHIFGRAMKTAVRSTSCMGATPAAIRPVCPVNAARLALHSGCRDRIRGGFANPPHSGEYCQVGRRAAVRMRGERERIGETGCLLLLGALIRFQQCADHGKRLVQRQGAAPAASWRRGIRRPG